MEPQSSSNGTQSPPQMPSSEGVAKILSQAQKAQQAQKDGANQEEIDDAVSDAVRMLQQERALRERAAKDAMALGQGDPIAKAKDTALNALKVVGYLPYNIMAGTWNALRVMVTDPKRAGANIKEGWGHFKEVMQHYWLGSKLLAADVRTATLLLSRVLSGHSLSRRERKQLLRTVTDVLRLVPFAVFVLVPFMELLLPVALKLFPNMLPSTFKSTLEREEEKKRQLQARLAMASFLQEAVREQAQSISKKGKAESADELLMLFEAMRQGEAVPADAISRAAKVFSDELTLDNMPRAQLSAMAQYMGLPSYGSDAMLRFQLRNHLRVIKQDDQQILWEGIDALNREELAMACQERGMRSTGLTKTQYRKQLQQWLDLSVNKDVPASLLILSRALAITHVAPEVVFKESLSAMDEGLIKELVLQSADGADDVTIRKLKLESNKYQEALMKEEADAAKAKADAEAAEALQDNATILDADQGKDIDVGHHDLDGPSKEATAVDLQPEELVALAALLGTSGVSSEREMLEKANVNQEFVEANSLLEKGRIGGKKKKKKKDKAPATDAVGAASDADDAARTEVEDDEADLSADKAVTTDRFKNYVNAMLAQLELDLVEAEAAIGSRLKRLDRNDDGMVTAKELADAMTEVLAVEYSEEEAWSVVRDLDQDNDGVVSVAQFMEWSKNRLTELRKQQELEASEAEDSKQQNPKKEGSTRDV